MLEMLEEELFGFGFGFEVMRVGGDVAGVFESCFGSDDGTERSSKGKKQAGPF